MKQLLAIGAGTGAGEMVLNHSGQIDYALLINALVSLVTVVLTNVIKSKQDKKQNQENLKTITQAVEAETNRRQLERKQKRKFGYRKPKQPLKK